MFITHIILLCHASSASQILLLSASDLWTFHLCDVNIPLHYASVLWTFHLCDVNIPFPLFCLLCFSNNSLHYASVLRELWTFHLCDVYIVILYSSFHASASDSLLALHYHAMLCISDNLLALYYPNNNTSASLFLSMTLATSVNGRIADGSRAWTCKTT